VRDGSVWAVPDRLAAAQDVVVILVETAPGDRRLRIGVGDTFAVDLHSPP
jgi:hypothetical protein